MKIRVITIILTFFFAATVSPPVFGQLGRIFGTVIDENGNPLEGVEIRIEGLNVKRNYKVKTKKDGKYLHAGVALQETYRVVAEKDGYQSDYVQGTRPSFGDEPRGKVDFVLKKGSGGKLAYELSEEELAELKKAAAEREKKQKEFGDMKAVFDQGMAAYEAQDYETAATAFEEASTKDDTQTAIWAYLGNTYQKLERYEDGIKAYQKAIELDPEDAGLHQNLGNLYAALNDTEKAKAEYEKAAQMSAADDPSKAAATYYNMGVTYINTGDNEQAAEALLKALEADPTHAEAHYQLGITMLGLGKLEDSIAHLKKYVELAPSGPNAETAKALVEQLGG
jgi:tetratricopeptide (TPR) repeat protein